MNAAILPSPFTRTVEIVAVRCGGCGVDWGMERAYYTKRLADHETFHCPNGCIRHFISETEADRLRKQLTKTESCLTYARQDVDRLRSTVKVRDRQVAARKGIITRFKRRITAGRCVCCSRQFKDLEAHMGKRHPGFDPERGAEMLASKPEGTAKP